MTNELLSPGVSSAGADRHQGIGGVDPRTPPAAPIVLHGVEGVYAWMRSTLTDPSAGDRAFSYSGRCFVLSVTSDLDVDFEFDFDPNPTSLGVTALKADLAALVMIVWCIAVRLGPASIVDWSSGEAVRETEAPRPDVPG